MFGNHHGPPSKRLMARDEEHQVERQRRYRAAADYVAAALARCRSVEAVALIGSVALPLWREVPRFYRYRRHGVAIAHECADVDLVAWVSRVDNLNELRRARIEGLKELFAATQQMNGTSANEVEIFLLEPVTNRYLGRLCRFAQCPADKRPCYEADCGREKFLQQTDGFVLWPETIAEQAMLRLYDRKAGGIVARAADLPSIVLDVEERPALGERRVARVKGANDDG